MTASETRRSRRSRICFSSNVLKTTASLGFTLGLTLAISAVFTVSGRAQPQDEPRLVTSIEELKRLVNDTPRESSISVSDGRRIRLAKEILHQDSTNVEALTELGVHHAANYHWYANFIAAKQPIGGGLERAMTREFYAAYRYLDQALFHDPESVDTYEELLRLLIQEEAFEEASEAANRLTNHRPDLPDGWALRGLVAQLQDRYELAEYFFSRALTRMAPPDRRRFMSSELFLKGPDVAARTADADSFDTAFWFRRDPLYLTEENERTADHLARMVYTDLQYGGAVIDGWDTERGRMIMRYGFPVADFTFTGALSRYNVLDFGDFEFVFEDQTRGGHFTLYSPKAGAGSSWTSDYVIQAEEMEIALPERFEFREMPATEIKTRVSTFRGSGDKTDVYIQYAVALERAGRPGLDTDPRSQVGGFVTLPHGEIHQTVGTEISGTATYLDLRPYRTGVLEFSLKPGTYGTSVEYVNFDRSAYGVERDSITIGGRNRSALEFSDVIPASAIDVESGSTAPNPGSIVRHGYVITPDPWSRVVQGGEALIYFEIYGLTVGGNGSASYQIDARVEPLESKGLFKSLFSIFGGGEPKGVTVSFEATTNAPEDHRWFAIDLSAQVPGAYELALDVVNVANGQTATKTIPLEIGEDGLK